MDNIFDDISVSDLEGLITSHYGMLTKDGVMWFKPEDGALYEAAKLAYERNISDMLK